MTTGTALVLGTNAGQADLIRYLVERDWRVIACAKAWAGPGEAHASYFRAIDIADIERVAALAELEKADIVYSIASDIAITTATKVSERLGLPHFFDSSLVHLFNSKPLLRSYLNERDLGLVEFLKVKSTADAADWRTFPCVVKPADAWGQRGVRKVAAPDALSNAVNEALRLSSTNTAVVEAFLNGVEISCNVIVQNEDILLSELSERMVHPSPMFGISSGHVIPAVHVTEVDRQAAQKLVTDVVRALPIKAGTLYFQIILTPNGPRVVEIAPRLDGCHLWRLIQAARGVNFLDVAFRTLVGDALPAPRLRGPAAGHVYELQFQQTPPTGLFDPAAFPVPYDAIYHEYRYSPNTIVKPVNGQMEVVGYYIRKR